MGRWINRDPIEYDGGLNLYGYCGDRPVGGLDPSGLFQFNIGLGGLIQFFGGLGGDAGFVIGSKGMGYYDDIYVGLGPGMGFSYGPELGFSLTGNGATSSTCSMSGLIGFDGPLSVGAAWPDGDFGDLSFTIPLPVHLPIPGGAGGDGNGGMYTRGVYEQHGWTYAQIWQNLTTWWW